jgi:hypothetical protein
MTSQYLKLKLYDEVRIHSSMYYSLHKIRRSLCSNIISSDIFKSLLPLIFILFVNWRQNGKLKSSKLILLIIKRNYLSNKKQGSNAEEFFVASTIMFE